MNREDVRNAVVRFVAWFERKFYGKPRSVIAGRVGDRDRQRFGIIGDSLWREGQTMTTRQPRHAVAWKRRERPPTNDQKEPGECQAQRPGLPVIHVALVAANESKAPALPDANRRSVRDRPCYIVLNVGLPRLIRAISPERLHQGAKSRFLLHSSRSAGTPALGARPLH